MEYLTLQDIPHRHCNPVHSHTMASQSSERPVGHMAAVCEYPSLSTPPPDSPTALFPPVPSPFSYDYACRIESLQRASEQPIRPLILITLPEASTAPRPAPTCMHRRLQGDLFRYSLECDMDPLKRDYDMSAICPSSPDSREAYTAWCKAKTRSQNHLQRSSPPLQPGEQNFPGKLPSFDEVSTAHDPFLSDTDLISSFRLPLRGHLHTRPHGEMILPRIPRMYAHSLTM